MGIDLELQFALLVNDSDLFSSSVQHRLMAREIFLDPLTDSHEAVQIAVSELEAGELVCLPDECGWNLVGLSTRETAANSLQIAQIEVSRKAISIAHPSVIEDLIVAAPRLLRKLTVRCWPGPVVIRGQEGRQERDAESGRIRAGRAETNGIINQWPILSRNWALAESGRAFYCPAESFSQEVLRAVSAPVLSVLGCGNVLEGLKRSQLPEPSVIIHSALSRFSAPPTVVAIGNSQFTLEKSGVVSERMLARLAGEVYLFVCTGNTCRSPMAEAIFRKMLADHLKCREDELMDHGFVVISAGLAAHRGSPAAPEAVELLRHDGIDLTSHESQPITEELLLHCDHILTMTRSHRDAVLSAYPELDGQVRLLSARSEDVPDPIGAGIDEYVRCRDMIAVNLEQLLAQVQAEGREGNGA